MNTPRTRVRRIQHCGLRPQAADLRSCCHHFHPMQGAPYGEITVTLHPHSEADMDLVLALEGAEHPDLNASHSLLREQVGEPYPDQVASQPLAALNDSYVEIGGGAGSELPRLPRPVPPTPTRGRRFVFRGEA